jgi:type I restriction enzyme R subunit
LPARLKQDFTGTMKLLRDPDFQDALLNYERVKPTFVIAHEVRDSVTSVRLFGRYDRPEDYLKDFEKFIRENTARIEALQVLVARPGGWNPDVLKDLLAALRRHDFEKADLQRAVAQVHHKVLVDIISIVKHAADDQQPLLNAEERVHQAVEELKAFHSFTADQEEWLDLIVQHLVKNLSIDAFDFDSQPVFSRRGGSAKARKVFGDELPALIGRLNYTLAT